MDSRIRGLVVGGLVDSSTVSWILRFLLWEPCSVTDQAMGLVLVVGTLLAYSVLTLLGLNALILSALAYRVGKNPGEPVMFAMQ
jgi:hypothetical protein